MAEFYHLLKDTALPRIARVRCSFDSSKIEDVAGTLRQELHRPDTGFPAG